MANTVLVNDLQCLQDLLRDDLGASSCLLRDFDISSQISVLHVLHCDEDVALVLVPSKELDEQMLVLEEIPVRTVVINTGDHVPPLK